jgi:hypothetical protein
MGGLIGVDRLEVGVDVPVTTQSGLTGCVWQTRVQTVPVTTQITSGLTKVGAVKKQVRVPVTTLGGLTIDLRLGGEYTFQ